jgi:2-iminobutanoate/2-iminopropanoate deaminase
MPLPLSPVRRVGELTVISGQIGRGSDGTVSESIREQTRAAIDSLSSLLDQEGLGLADVFKTTVFVTDMGDSTVVNDEYGKAFSQPFPSRSMVEVSRLPVESAAVEIEAWAANRSQRAEEEAR